MQPIEIPLKAKYRQPKQYKRQHGNYNGRNRASAGKHTPHPVVHAYRRNGYRCEPKWNPKPQEME